MKTKDFFYDLPNELIAQDPLEKRDHSKLMMLNRKTGEINHSKFYDIVDKLMPEDCLILNNSKVLPARIFGVKEGTGARVEFLLLNRISENTWEALAGPGKRAKEGIRFNFGKGLMYGTVVQVKENGNRVVKFEYNGNFYECLDEIGQMPLPHYITHSLEDKERYQTVYAKDLGSAAAPTAGLHFTKELLQKILDKGVKIGYVTLHVGLGTFRPVKVENVPEHKMHSEYYSIPEETANLIRETRKKGGRVIAVGTTSCRTLESMYKKKGKIESCRGWTDIFIYPGYDFKVIDAIITNFHLPESTLIMLISAFAGKELVFEAYKNAVHNKYRFFSFGDAMFIY